MKKRVMVFFLLSPLLVPTAVNAESALDYGRAPVLFVHGHGMNSSSWTELKAYLIGRGYPPEYLQAVDIVPNTASNILAANTVIAPAAETLLLSAAETARNAGYKGKAPQRLDIVSFSMGAVSSRWYAAKLHPERVRIWIGLGGANHGTDALCLFSDEGAREMCPAFATTGEKNYVQVALNGTPEAPVDETPYGLGSDRAEITPIPADSVRRVVYFTIRIEPDVWIQPGSSAVLDGAGGIPVKVPAGMAIEETSPGNYLFRGSAGHDDLPKQPDSMQIVASLLTGIRG